MHENSRSQHALTEAHPPEAIGEIGYEHMLVTKVPGWHGIIAWDALLNGMATGLFLTAAVSELAAPAIFMHVARRTFAPTAGCVALSREHLSRLLAALCRWAAVSAGETPRPLYRGRRGLR